MRVQPRDVDHLSRLLAEASATGTKVTEFDLTSLNRLIRHTPEDMTATVEGGMSFSSFQRALAPHRQWLPLDPSNQDALTIGDLLAYNSSGPRRFGFGTARDYLIGIKVVLGDGQIIKAGGNVVKNVAGYDLCKLFIGARHTLGVIVEANFKLRPIAETEVVVQAVFDSLDALARAAGLVFESPVDPVIFDAHNLEDNFALVLGFSGAREDVDYQTSLISSIAAWTPSNTRYAQQFSSLPYQEISLLPSKTIDYLDQVRPGYFVARLGNGIVYYRDPTNEPAVQSQVDSINRALMHRIKDSYDPKHILPELT
jgi:FAD/FMN-containing dehydrogenase